MHDPNDKPYNYETIECRECGKVTLMRMHPTCISSMIRRDDAATNNGLSKLCITCPMRKDMPVWEPRLYVIINRIRVRLGLLQRCHTDHDKHCVGMATCVRGGSGKVSAPDEYAARATTATFNDMSGRAWNVMKDRLQLAEDQRKIQHGQAE